MPGKGRRDALSDRVRRMLVSSLYAQPSSLAIGAINGLVSSSIAAYASGSKLLYVISLVIGVVAIVRVIAAVALNANRDNTSTRKLELVYEIGAFSYASLLGMFAALTMVLQTGTGVQVLMLANAIGYGIGICARNAGRPMIAMGQLTLSTVPIVFGALYVGDVTFVAMAATLFLLLPAMGTIVNNLFKVLRDSIASAETSSKLAERMKVLAETDVVTGLANRAGLNNALVEQLMALPAERSLALFWLDLDRFKEVNDLLGHPVGDRVLGEVAERLCNIAPEGSTIARFGGDEFILVCPVDNRKRCEQLSADVLAEIQRPMRIDGELLNVPTSMGVAILPEDAHDADSLMQAADLALYQAKVGGRNQVRFYDTSMSRDLMRRREIEAELRAAIQRDELSIYFQPIVDLQSGRIRTFEALVRWFHPEKGELRPDEFIPVAEETGVIVTLGNWITRQAAIAAASWPEDVTIAVNLSPLQIRAPGAALGIQSALREAGLDPHRLELEVTESLFLDDNESTAAFIEELSAMGVRFALDDFGTGYSSLGYINKFPFSKIKVDRSFVSGPNVGKKSDAIIRAVAEMGNRLGMDIVAEGLETREQVHTVADAGCTLGQGYYFSRAVPDYIAATLLAQERSEGETRARANGR
ncbi:putative bifunctional diguanylate cyclase/phosphodiesterase [Tsuneonella mangrovi]|uniref:putative bifunctional diguanylate cyclase/phosphodiesterase n=1 Tax=Tsuneonella mangrovi TaxID=1982042 RepID=UPI000BA26CC0|nr:EAL domain-containing protein [Tsuneonella mangrovi]